MIKKLGMKGNLFFVTSRSGKEVTNNRWRPRNKFKDVGTPMELFKLFFANEMIEFTVTCTNNKIIDIRVIH